MHGSDRSARTGLPRTSTHQRFAAQSAAFERLTDARRWAQQTEAAIREGRHFKTVEAKKHTAGELIDRYIRDVIPTTKPNSRGTQKAQLEWWKKQIGAHLLTNVTPVILAEYGVEQQAHLVSHPGA